MATLIPREVFVADKAEFIHSFVPESTDFIKTYKPSDKKSVTIDIDKTLISSDVDSSGFESYTVLNSYIEISDSECKLYIQFIPWKAGQINFSTISLSNYQIEIPPAIISSITEKTGKTTIQNYIPPLLVPGTTYILSLSLFFAIIFVISLIIGISRLKSIKRTFSTLFTRICLSKNARITLKKLKKLQKQVGKISTAIHATELSYIMRSYLDARFSSLFLSATPSEILKLFNNTVGEVYNEHQAEIFFKVQSLFIRLDYLKFSGNFNELPVDSIQKDLVALELLCKNLVLYFEDRRSFFDVEDSNVVL